MKRFFTLFAFVLIVIGAQGSATTDREIVSIIDMFNYTWNEDESLVRNADGSITFTSVSWGGMAAWMEGEMPDDWSEYEKLVFEFAEPTSVNAQGFVQTVYEEFRFLGDVGVTRLECQFEGADVSAVKQVALQTSAPSSITITAIYLVKKVKEESEGAFESANSAVKNMGIGWNLWNTLDSHSGGADWGITTPEGWETCWGNAVTKPELMKMVRKAGFSAVRVPVTWYPHMDDDGKVDPAWMKRVHEVVDYVVDQGMYCLLNVHHDGDRWIKAEEANYQENHERFEFLWRQIAEEFKDYDQHLIFEGFNELTDKNNAFVLPTDEYGEEYRQGAFKAINAYAQSFVDAVRSTGGNNLERNLLVNIYSACMAPTDWGAEPLEMMEIPKDATNDHVIFGVHCYWMGGNNDVDGIIRNINVHFTARGIPTIVGEWGAFNEGDNHFESHHAYFLKRSKAHGIATFLWGSVCGGVLRRLPAVEKPEEVEAVMKAYYGDSYEPRLLGIEDYEYKGVDVSYDYLWAELDLCNKLLSLDEYKGIRVELENAEDLIVKVYGEADGKVQYCGISSAMQTFIFNKSELGDSILGITLQNTKDGANEAKIHYVYLIRNDDTEDTLSFVDFSVYHGCSLEPIIPRKQVEQTAAFHGLWSELNIYYDDIPLKLKNYKGIRLELAELPVNDTFHIKVYGDEGLKEDYLPLEGAKTTILFNTDLFNSEINRVTLQYAQEGDEQVRVLGAWLIRNDGTEEFSDITPYWGCELFESSKLKGDANRDGVVDIADVMITVYKILAKPVPDFHMEEADINQDGIIDITDVMGIVNILLGKPLLQHPHITSGTTADSPILLETARYIPNETPPKKRLCPFY